MDYLWGIDLGGTKIEGVVLSVDNLSTPIARERISTEAEKGYAHIINRVHELITILINKSSLRPTKIGFGTPGIFDRCDQKMKNCNTTCLNGRNLKKDLADKLKKDILISNDANCFIIAESILGAAGKFNSAFGIIMGTGVGGGITVNKKLHQGLHGIAGEWGHNQLLENGEPCYCGKKGCVETVISGPALERYYKTLSHKEMKLPQICEAAKNGDALALQTMEYLVANFAKAVSTVINIMDPEVIVLGGGVSNIERLYTEGLAEIGKYIFNDKVQTKIVQNALGDSAGVFGAAMLCQDYHNERNKD